jgi:hypothetical protein
LVPPTLPLSGIFHPERLESPAVADLNLSGIIRPNKFEEGSS